MNHSLRSLLPSMLIAGLAASAQTPVAIDSLLPTAYIVGSQRRATSPRQRLAGQQLHAFDGHSVANALRYFAGLQVKDYGGIGGMKTIDVRGMGSTHVGVFLDGMPVANEQNGQVDFARFETDGLERVELYNGHRTQLLQSAREYASGSTVYLESRRPDPHFTGSRLTLKCRTGSFGRAEPSVRWERRLASGMAADVSGGWLTAHGRYRFHVRKRFPDGSVAYDTTALRTGGDVHALRLEANLHSSPRSLAQWDVKASTYGAERGIPAAIVNNVWSSAQRQWDATAFVQGRWQRSWRAYTLRLSAKGGVERLRYQDPDTTRMPTDRTFLQPQLSLSAVHALVLAAGDAARPRFEFSLATDYACHVLRQTSRLALPPDMLLSPVRHTLMVAATAGLSWQRWQIRGVALETLTAEDGGAPSLQRRSPDFSPALHVAYRPMAGVAVRCFAKRHQRRPTLTELYYTELGNVRLRPERCWQIDAGAEAERSWADGRWQLSARADAYMEWVDDKIIAVPRGSGGWRWLMMNVGRMVGSGCDVACRLSWQPSPVLPLLTAGGNYGFLRAEDRTDPADNDPHYGTYRGQIAFQPRHAAGVFLGAAWRGLQLNYSFTYVGERFKSSANMPSDRMAPWQTHDVAVVAEMPFLRCLQMGAECCNLAGRQYAIVPNYPMPGRHFSITLKASFPFSRKVGSIN